MTTALFVIALTCIALSFVLSSWMCRERGAPVWLLFLTIATAVGLSVVNIINYGR